MKIIVLKNGEKLQVVKEDSNYMYCEGTQFKHNHPDIAEIISGKQAEEEMFGNMPDIEQLEKEVAAEMKVLEKMTAPKKTAAPKKNASKK